MRMWDRGGTTRESAFTLRKIGFGKGKTIFLRVFDPQKGQSSSPVNPTCGYRLFCRFASNEPGSVAARHKQKPRNKSAVSDCR